MANAWGSSWGSAWGSSWGSSAAAATSTVPRPTFRYRRGPLIWIDEDGNEVKLLFDEDGGRHVRTRPTGKKAYKPVRQIRVPR